MNNMPSEHDPRELLEQTFTVFPPPSLNVARRELEVLRRRQIRIVISEPPDDLVLPTGFWAVLGPTLDLVWADAGLSPFHQLVTICHELGHMICGHAPTEFTDSGPAEVVDGVARAAISRLAGSAPTQPTAALGRCGMELPADDHVGRRREHEAETVGRLLARPFLSAHQTQLGALLIGH